MSSYSRTDFLEFFDNEIIVNEEAGLYKYDIIIENIFKLELSIHIYDDFSSITLYYKDIKTPIFEIGIDNLEKISIRDNKFLEFYKKNHKNPFVTVLAKDRVYLKANL